MADVAMRTRPVRSVVAVRALKPAGVTTREPSRPAIVSADVANSTMPRFSDVAPFNWKFVSPIVTESGLRLLTSKSIERYASETAAF